MYYNFKRKVMNFYVFFSKTHWSLPAYWDHLCMHFFNETIYLMRPFVNAFVCDSMKELESSSYLTALRNIFCIGWHSGYQNLKSVSSRNLLLVFPSLHLVSSHFLGSLVEKWWLVGSICFTVDKKRTFYCGGRHNIIFKDSIIMRNNIYFLEHYNFFPQWQV